MRWVLNLLKRAARSYRAAASTGSDEPLHISPAVYCDRNLPRRWKLRQDTIVRGASSC
jgi:hypothetical protein